MSPLRRGAIDCVRASESVAVLEPIRDMGKLADLKSLSEEGIVTCASFEG
jgi:hypothetical protein